MENDIMEPHGCSALSDIGLFTSHLGSERPTPPSGREKMGGYKCSQCSEVFSGPGLLKRHFRVAHSGRGPEGPFPCTEQGCRFSSAGRQEYQAHLMSTHGLTLVPCNLRSCKVSFLTQDEMERHFRGHMPFGCFQCQFVTLNGKDMNDHLMQHNHRPPAAQDKETAATELTNGSHRPHAPGRPKRALIPKPVHASSLTEDRNEDSSEGERCNIKRARKAVERDKPSALKAASLPSKEYLAEGSEQTYRTHTCPKCRRCFKMRSHLQEHLHLHFPDPSLQCPNCKRYFTSKSKLRLHRLREAGHKVHRCHLCEYSAVERNAIRRHVASVHADEAEGGGNARTYPCPSCGQSFHQSRSLKAHMKTHNIVSGSEPAACFREGCSFHSSVPKELLRHSAEAHGVTAVECRHHACGAVFQSETDMQAHYRKHLAYHCSQCDFSCSNKAVLLQHQRHGHPGNHQLCCDFCSFVTFNPVEFRQHVGHLHASEKIHRCSQCSYVTSHERGLKRHMLMHSGEKPHKCSLCDFRCRDESYLSRHMLTHSDDKNYMCAECGYVTKWKHYLSVHMRKHSGDLRYRCDQCPYRCHRMDQLNSHKLRHQAKSLMCEICAYACKRKYELRNHMVAKHSGQETPPSILKCKYCTYTTCYRQALQNHENCKHTKLKEFRCALCFYCSFSSISLFLHKRKAHGYVPGDKAWLENYAAKEKERNSTEFSQDFYDKPRVVHEQAEPAACEEPPCHREHDSADHCAGKQSKDGSRTGESVDALEVANDGVSNSPEEYCTLVLTTLSTTDYQTSSSPPLQSQEGHCTNQTPSTDHPDHKGVDVPQEEVDSCTSSSEEDNIATADAEGGQSDSDDTFVPLSDTSQPVVPRQCQTSTGENGGRSLASTFPSEQNKPSESEIRLKAMKKHDKDQADAMVLEGRVQMLVVPSKDVHRCERCSSVSRRQSALQASCCGGTKGHKCHDCGAQFRQKRGLDSHRANKCPALPPITRQDKSSEGQGGSEQIDASNADPLELLSRDSTDKKCKGFVQTKQRSQVTLSKKRFSSSKQQQFTPLLRSLHAKKDGKFKCKLCSFSSIRLTTVERHLSLCRKILKKCESPIVPAVGDELRLEVVHDQEEVEERKDGNVSGKAKLLSCPSCAFKCSQKRALDSHEKRGCLKPDQLQCTMCPLVTTSPTSLTRHMTRAHNDGEGAPAKLCTLACTQERRRPHRCGFCPFSTARRYRLDQHLSLHTGVGRHSCDACDKTFGAAAKLRQHKARVHDKRPTHFCPLCDFSGYTLEDVRRHDLRSHAGGPRHACAHCEARFSSEVALRNHRKRAHRLQVGSPRGSEGSPKSRCESERPGVKWTGEGLDTHLPHRCQLCPFGAKTRQLLARHLLGEHEEGSAQEKPFKCSSCPFACRHQLVLEQHLRSHGGQRLYKCTDCEYASRNKQKITWHIRIHTGEKPYSCERCSYTCSDPSRLKLHMRVHQEEKKYLCPDCGYKCKWATQLKYHMTKHTGDKPHACDECDYRTNRADALRAHRDTQHCDLRPYVCEKCGKAFKTSFILKTHQRQHSDERPYSCGSCHKAFRWPAGLRHHFLSHTKQQPFCCRHCSYRAKQKFQVVKHLRRHHPEVSVEQGVVKDSQAVSLTLKEALQGTLGEKAAAAEEEEEEEEGIGDDARSKDVVVQREEDSETKR
ncbi:zinc finger protein 142 isoform X1 [Pungitius pungitius]|uniref:zinc finger protein 142 isoform X1 n=2 Tax=Pungitius pungitius TaxID=134920 RepID=UPI002E0DE382